MTTAEELRAIARDFDISGPQYAHLSRVLRKAADELDTSRPSACARPADSPVFDGDSVPAAGRPCPNCWDD